MGLSNYGKNRRKRSNSTPHNPESTQLIDYIQAMFRCTATYTVMDHPLESMVFHETRLAVVGSGRIHLLFLNVNQPGLLTAFVLHSTRWHTNRCVSSYPGWTLRKWAPTSRTGPRCTLLQFWEFDPRGVSGLKGNVRARVKTLTPHGY